MVIQVRMIQKSLDIVFLPLPPKTYREKEYCNLHKTGLLEHKLYQKQETAFLWGSGYQELWCYQVGWGKGGWWVERARTPASPRVALFYTAICCKNFYLKISFDSTPTKDFKVNKLMGKSDQWKIDLGLKPGLAMTLYNYLALVLFYNRAPIG